VAGHIGLELRKVAANYPFERSRRFLWILANSTHQRLFAFEPTLETMLSRRDQLEVAIVPDQGHAPLLAEAKLIRRIAAFAASCDFSTRP
jgi:hypothetical protein